MITEAKPKVQTVSEVVEGIRLWEQEHGPFDRTSKLNLFQYVVEEGKGGALVPLSTQTHTGEAINLPTMYFKPNAFNQFLQRLDYSKRLYDRVPTKLNIMNINWLIQNHSGGGAMFRLQDGDQMRALMGPKYNSFDNLELLALLEPFCGDGLVRWYFNDDSTLHLSISFPSLADEAKVGDVVERGIHISNSEIGLRAVTVAGYVHVLSCKNGMIGTGDGDIYRFRHVGDQDRLRDMVKGAVDSVMMEAEKIVAQFKGAMGKAIDDPFSTLEQFSKDNDVSQEVFKSMLDTLLSSDDRNTLYGVTQAVTATAHKYEGEQAYELQRLGSKLLGAGSAY